MPSFLSLSVRASRSLWRSPPTASSSFAACVSTPFPTPFRNSTTPTLAASRRNPTPVTRKEAPRDQGGGGGEGVYLGRAGRGTLSPEPHRRRGGGGAREMRTRGPWDGGARGESVGWRDGAAAAAAGAGTLFLGGRSRRGARLIEATWALAFWAFLTPTPNSALIGESRRRRDLTYVNWTYSKFPFLN